MRVEKAVIIDEPWISEILAGRKTWEMRKRPWKHRGPLGLIRKGSGRIVGVATMVGCHPPLTSRAAYAGAFDRHRIPPERQASAFDDGWCVPWEFRDVRPLRQPVPYLHPNGAVISVNLDPAVVDAIGWQLEAARTNL